MSATVDKSSKILVLGEDDRWMAVSHKLVQVLGRNEAEFVQKLHYWLTTESGMIRDGVRWIYNTYDQWKEQQGHLSKMTIRRIVHKLEKLGVILCGNFNKKKSDRTKWYTLAYDVLMALIGKEDNHQQEESREEADKKMNSPCVQFEHITTKRLTTDTSLNGATAPQTFQSRVEDEQPKGVELAKTPFEINSADPSPIEQQALQILEEVINPHLDQPLQINKPLFKNTLLKRMKTHFGQGKAGLERFKKYCTQYAMNAFLMGKKAMKSGDRFITSVGSILSEKMIEDSWQGRGFFYLYAPQPTPIHAQEEETMGRRAQPIPLPPVSLEEVLDAAESAFDKHVKRELYQNLGEVIYKAWFHTTGFIARGISNGEPAFFISSAFAKDYVLDHYGSQLKKAFRCWEEEGSRNR